MNVSLLQTPVQKAKLTNLANLYEQAVKGCAYGSDYQKEVIDCSYSSDDDLGNFARDSNFPATTEEPTELGTNPRFGGSTESPVNFGRR